MFQYLVLCDMASAVSENEIMKLVLARHSVAYSFQARTTARIMPTAYHAEFGEERSGKQPGQ